MYHIDKTHLTTQAFKYDSFGTVDCTINISGSLNDGQMKIYQFTVISDDERLQCRSFIKRADGTLLTPIGAGFRLAYDAPEFVIYQPIDTELAVIDEHYEDNGRRYVVAFAIVNDTGSTISLITQVLKLFIEVYEAPLQW